MKSGISEIGSKNKIVLHNPSELYVGLSLWVAPTEYGDFNHLEHGEFWIRRHDAGLNARMLRSRMQKVIRNLMVQCQRDPEELEKKFKALDLGHGQQCMQEIQEELGLDFDGLKVLEVETNLLQPRDKIQSQPE